uniref:Uncharacterized protein n=1 Tax=Salix viminalis TaxID=40686 RepID=A0A6N2NDR3_SALVM
MISPFSRTINEFIGLLPTQYIANFQAMKKVDEEVKPTPKYIGEIYYQDSIVLTMKGTEIPMERILTIFTTIDLSNNRFEGQIPKEVGLLSSLLALNISRNRLTGQIPSSLGSLTALESLDLSSNGLDGGIPSQSNHRERRSCKIIRLEVCHDRLWKWAGDWIVHGIYCIRDRKATMVRKEEMVKKEDKEEFLKMLVVFSG